MSYIISNSEMEWNERIKKFDIELRNCPGLECRGARTLEVNEYEGSGYCKTCGEQYNPQIYEDFQGYAIEQEEANNMNDDVSRFIKSHIKLDSKLKKIDDKVHKEFETKKEKSDHAKQAALVELDKLFSIKLNNVHFPPKTKTAIQEIYGKFVETYTERNVNHLSVYLAILYNLGLTDYEFQHYTMAELWEIFNFNKFSNNKIDINKSILNFNKRVKGLFNEQTFTAQITKNWKWFSMILQQHGVSTVQIDLVTPKIHELKLITINYKENFIQAKSFVGCVCCLVLKSRHFYFKGKKRSFNCTSIAEMMCVSSNAITNNLKVYKLLLNCTN